MITRKLRETVAARGAENFDASHDVDRSDWSYAFHIASHTNVSWSVSSGCRTAMERLLLSKDYNALAALSIATEASSHPSGLTSLKSQPWVYSGGGLGNGDECRILNNNAGNDNGVGFHSCIAGLAANRAASLPFASICIPSDCTAHDLASNQMLPMLRQYLEAPPTTLWLQKSVELRDEYVTTVERIHDLNKFLGTGWVCGEFEMPWNPLAVAPFLCLCLFLVVCVTRATLKKYMARIEPSRRRNNELTRLLVDTKGFWSEYGYDEGEKKETENGKDPIHVPYYDATPRDCINRTTTPSTASECSSDSVKQSDEERVDEDLALQQIHEGYHQWHWTSAFNLRTNVTRLVSVHDGRTACLDGLRVGSLLWILLGHVMAIESSTGAGYSNPAAFLPPSGWTTTITGQLLFSSRMAVDTFFCISGFLLVHILDRKMNWEKQNWGTLLCKTYPILIVSRVVRILPVYAFCLWFYMHIAPHLGSGPFWYQWQGLLMPCQGVNWIRNLMFTNNLIDGPITESCFYHSWYLAVDMQLYAVSLLLLLSMYNYDARQYYRHRLKVIATLSILSVCWTVYCTWTRRWSLNTFDGEAVMRYDGEGYANPLVRAQSYFTGMLVACLVYLNDGDHQIITRTHRQNFSLLVAFIAMVFVAFITSAGAYAQRPCQYNEWPQYGQCGSTWSPFLTFLYTAFSRTIWNTGLCIVIYTCVTGSHPKERGNIVASILSWRVWTLLSNLSFGAYLIHPIVIFVWQLGGRQKAIFSLLSFGMTNFSIAVASFVASFVVALLVELPAAHLWRKLTM